MRQATRYCVARTAYMLLAGMAVMLSACGDDGPTAPTSVPYGQTTFVTIVNPAINSITNVSVPTPDTARAGVLVSVGNGPTDTTDSTGVAVLSPVAAGEKLLGFTREQRSGQVTSNIASRDLHEVAVAFTANGTAVMADVGYAFGGEVVVVSSDMPIGEVNAALARSNVIVFFRRGIYRGDLSFNGSSVTLYGEGARGGVVTIDGSVTVSGSNNRIRGARITGNLTVPASAFGMSFSRVGGSVSISGSSPVLLNNAFCSGENVSIPASNVTALGNRGLAPIPAPGDC